MKGRGLVVVTFVASLVAPRVAAAQEEVPPLPPPQAQTEPQPRPQAQTEPPQPPPPPQFARMEGEETHWYGWQPLVADAATVMLTFATKNAGVFLVMYLVPSPVIHGLHGRAGVGAGALGIRFGMPTVSGLVGGLIDASNCSGELCGLGGLVVGAFIGYVGAVVIDAAALSFETVRVERQALRWTPTVGTTPKGGPSLGVSGTF